jgi:uroporphyrinogen decarboxylase
VHSNRTRAINILHFRKTDRLPAVHFGYWTELIEEWAALGHIPRDFVGRWGDGGDTDRELDKLLGWDHNWSVTFGGDMGLRPQFERKVLEKLPDGFLRVQNGDGLIERVKEGAQGIPAEDDYQLKDRKAFEELYKPKMRYSDDRVDWAFFRNFNAGREKYDCPVGLWAGSVLGSIRNMFSIVGLSYALADDYELVAEIVDTYADMQYKVAEKVLSTGARFDFAHFWEDVCFKNGPLISPVMFEDLCAKHYKRMAALLNAHGVDIISLDCDGVTDRLLPVWVENGVNTMFPIEVGTWGDQFAAARKKYGNKVLGVGGMDKTVLLRDRKAVDAEIERLRPLIALGGFVPCPDHRLMPGTKWELLQYYIEAIKNVKF